MEDQSNDFHHAHPRGMGVMHTHTCDQQLTLFPASRASEPIEWEDGDISVNSQQGNKHTQTLTPATAKAMSSEVIRRYTHTHANSVPDFTSFQSSCMLPLSLTGWPFNILSAAPNKANTAHDVSWSVRLHGSTCGHTTLTDIIVRVYDFHVGVRCVAAVKVLVCVTRLIHLQFLCLTLC